MLSVNVILSPENRAWIIEKIARRLAAHAPAHGVDVALSDRPNPAADVNHWASYAFANEPRLTPTTMLITHVDDPYKARLIRQELQSDVDVGICMSSQTVQSLINLGVPATSLCYIPPAHDGLMLPRRLVIGIATRVYSDGRKREKLLIRLSQQVSLESFCFRIFGSGWDSVIPHLWTAGATVEYDPGSADYVADYARVVAAMPHFDYYLYLGMDEGSLGTLDALAAGVPTIVTPQGFHLDLLPAISHTFVEYEDLEAILKKIIRERDTRLQLASELNWTSYARRHALVWHAAFSGRARDAASALAADLPVAGAPPAEMLRHGPMRYYLRALSPRRILSALSHMPALKPLKRVVRRMANPSR